MCGLAVSQITDSDQSAQYLADHIATSSGGTSAQYLTYARDLARTLSRLSLEKQEQILGFLPAGGGGEIAGSGGGGSPTGSDPVDGGPADGAGGDPADGGEDPGPGSDGGGAGDAVADSGEDPADSDDTDDNPTETGDTGDATGGSTGGGSTGGGGLSGGSSGGLVVGGSSGGGSSSGTGGGGAGGVYGGGGTGGAIGGTDPCNQLDGTPLNVAYPAANPAATNQVIADAAKAYWEMHVAANLALSSGSSQIYSHNSAAWWNYNGQGLFPGNKTASELQILIDAQSAQVEGALSVWLSANGGVYPAAWPPSMPGVSDPFWTTACP